MTAQSLFTYIHVVTNTGCIYGEYRQRTFISRFCYGSTSVSRALLSLGESLLARFQLAYAPFHPLPHASFMMVRRTPGIKNSAILVDGGATDFMTNCLQGLIGKLKKVTGESFITAAGPKSFEMSGFFRKVVYGMDGVSVEVPTVMWYDPSLAFDIYGLPALRKLMGAVYIDADSPVAPTLPARLRLTFVGDLELKLGRTKNGLEWLSYDAPRVVALSVWSEDDAHALSGKGNASLSVMSSGAGMGPLAKNLTELEAAILDHTRRGHPSLKRAAFSRKVTVGGLTVTREGTRQLAILGCDVCNAYKIKLVDPKAKHSPSENPDNLTIRIMLYDVFGKVPYPSAQYKYQYSHLFVSKLKTIGWLKGSKSLDSPTVVDVHQKIYIELTAYFPNEKIQIIRMDSFSTHRGQEMTKFFLSALQHAQFTPPGQHAFLGDLERWWYPLFLRVLVGLRQSGANRIHWFSAMADALDKECALCNDLGSDAPTCGYQRAFGVVHNVSDLFSFYAPCRFSLDKAGLASKWMERARAGFWVGRDVSFVMNGTVGSAIIWDGNIHRTVVHRYFVQEGGFLNITAPGNRLLPTFPATGPRASVVPDVASVDVVGAGPNPAPMPIPFDLYKAAMERAAAGVPFASDEVSLSGAVSSGVAMSDGTIMAASDVVLSPGQASPVSEPFVPLSLQRPKRMGADTHRTPAVACLLCNSDCYMELCSNCDADWAENGGVTLALSHGGLPQSDFVDGLSPLDAYGKFSSSPHNFSPSSAVPTMRSVLSLMSGDYYAADGYTAQMRAIDRGVIQVDNDEIVGGGVKADLTSNATLAFCNLVLDSRLVSGVVSAQRCGSGSVVRFRVDESNPDLPEPSRDVFSPDGKAGLLPLYKKEIHTSQLLSYRVTKLSADCFWMGGWFLAECPAMRGDMHSILFYDPAFATHSSVQRNAYWLRLWKATGAICVSMNLCVLRSKYPPKAEDIMFSPNLAGALHQKLKSLACPHPAGTHVVQFSKEPSELKKTATWLPELASILVEATAGLTPMGGASLNLGVDDVVDFAMSHLRTRDMEHYIALESSSLRLQHPSSTVVDAKVMAAAEAIRSEDASYGDEFSVVCPWMRYEVEGDVDQDPRLEPVLYGINCSGSDVSLDREAWEFYSNGKSVFVTLAAPIVPHPPPQTEAALMADPNRDIYLATDQNEIDTLCAIPVWEEVWADPKEVSRPWRLRFVRSLKESAKTGEQTPRSRLVMIGPLHEAKIEFDRADSPTPMWATTVLVMAVGTVRGMQQLQFDLKQFFQHTDISTPSGELIGIPPRRYQAQRGNLRLYWSFLKWIQGARGAGRASHLFIVSVILDRGSGLRFFQSMHDPCYFRHIEEDGEVHFTLHVDDGIGWASNKVLGKKLEDWLRKCWPELKWFWEWADVMGFDVNTNPTQRTLGFTAPKHISALRALVASDCSFTPKSPSAADIGTLYACEVPDDKGSLEHLLFVNRVSFCQQGLGSLRHISKIRCDIAGAIGFQSRFSHAPQVDLPKHIKYTCLYLLGTIDFGPTFGGPSVVFKDLSIGEKLDDDYELDVDGHKLYFYHCVLDGALSIDRSRCGIMHMFAGGCFNGLSYTQHSIAKDANDSEVFTASSGCAQSIPYRGILREMGVNMAIATPIFSDSRSTTSDIYLCGCAQAIYLLGSPCPIYARRNRGR